MSDDLSAALALWRAEAPRFISHSENAVYEVRVAGRRAALRLHRPGYQDRAAIWSEAWWTNALAAAGLAVPRPQKTPAGDWIGELPGGRLSTLVDWAEGAPLEDATATEAQFFTIGATLARLHAITETLALPPGFRRPAWDEDGLIGPAPLWGRFWDNPTLAPEERALLLDARARAHEMLRACRRNGGDFGLIHADPLRGNMLIRGGQVTLIDFDDSGFGFRAYDLAVLMTQNEHLDNAGALLAAAVAGYRSVRAMDATTEALIPVLVMARRMASAGWVIARAPDSPAMRDYAQRAVDAARRFLAEPVRR